LGVEAALAARDSLYQDFRVGIDENAHNGLSIKDGPLLCNTGATFAPISKMRRSYKPKC
jgi:hypothetical protein